MDGPLHCACHLTRNPNDEQADDSIDGAAGKARAGPAGVAGAGERARRVGAGRLAVAVWDALETMPAYAAEVALLERLAGWPAAEALRELVNTEIGISTSTAAFTPE